MADEARAAMSEANGKKGGKNHQGGQFMAQLGRAVQVDSLTVSKPVLKAPLVSALDSLTVTKPVLKAPLVSALETKI